MTKRRATDDSLGGLHEVLADSYAKYLADVKSGAVEPDPRMMKEIRESSRITPSRLYLSK